MRSAVLLALACAACSGHGAERSPRPAPEAAPPLAATPARDAGSRRADRRPPADAAPPVDCARYHRALAGLVGRTLHAAAGAEYQDEALERWRRAPAPCRNARWHLQAARLARWSGEPVEDGATRFANASAALTAGLALDPDRELLALVAFVAALGDEPALPDDACARAERAPPLPGPAYESADAAAYVCGHAALRDGDYQEAARRFAAITMRDHFPDLALRQAQAARCLGRRHDLAHYGHAARRLDPRLTVLFGATLHEHETLRRAASSRELRHYRCRINDSHE